MPDLMLEIATPERLVLHEQVSEVEIPGRDGYFGVLPGHAPLMSELAYGVLRYAMGGNNSYISVMGGFVEVRDDKVRVLADRAVRKEEIDLEKARAELKQAQDALSKPSDDGAQALLDSQRAQALIDTASH